MGKDESLWGGPGVPEIGNRLGWLTISEKMLEHADELRRVRRIRSRRTASPTWPSSAWAARASGRRSSGARSARSPAGCGCTCWTPPTPAPCSTWSARWTWSTRFFVVSSKSGGTIETLSHMRHFLERTGGDGSRFVVVTDPGSPLVDTARELGFRRVFENDPNIGGRYSVLSYFGLVPAGAGGRERRGAAGRAQVAEQNSTSFDDTELQLRPLAGPGDGRAGAAGPRQGHVRRVPADRELRPLGRAARSPSPPASRARASCRWPTSRSARRRPTATTACSSTCATPTSRTRSWTQRVEALAEPATRRSRCTCTGRPTSGGSSSSPSSPPRWPAGCSASTRSTSPTCRRPRTTPPRC